MTNDRYQNIPQEMQSMRRWVGYKLEYVNDRLTKVPYNAITGAKAASNGANTWTTFPVALNGIAKYGFAGLGFMLGDGISGIDLDNHEGEGQMSDEDFKVFAQKFIDKMNSYTERSVSGKGIHIICKGTLPEGRRRKGPVEMYSKGRFFACTGDVVLPENVNDRQAELEELWAEYVDEPMETKVVVPTSEFDFSGSFAYGTLGKTSLSDTEVINKAQSAQNGSEFYRVWTGDISAYGGDQSSADLGLCSYLAFWCNGDQNQIDRLFRSSPYFASKDQAHVRKWDSLRGSTTYGQMVLDAATRSLTKGYTPPVKKTPIFAEKAPTTTSSDDYMNIDENGEPIFRIKQIFKNYSFTDTGNAERFYDQFGEIFKYNKKSKVFMFWTGKTWIVDEKDIIKKYANKLTEIMEDDIKRLERESKDANNEDNEDEAKKLKNISTAASKNVDRLLNKAGKEAMLTELQSLYDIPVLPEEFDKDPYLLNTDSGIVDLKTGIVSAWDKKKMLSKNTHVKVSYETPTTWIDFLYSIFYRGNGEKQKKETSDIIEYFQQVLWYTMTGSTREQCLFILHGGGSNGKSTCVNQISHIMGDYANSMDSNMLMQQAGTNTSVQFTLAGLIGCRFLITKESNDGDRLDEGLVKGLTGGDQINAQEKFGKPFVFTPQFKAFLMTNNLPFIRGTDYGIWRRIVLIPFLRRFADHEKDMDMPAKLEAESDKILGWIIQGGKKYLQNGKLVAPDCLKDALGLYQSDNDVVSKFLAKCTKNNISGQESCTDVFNAFKRWGDNNKEFVMRESKFNDMITSKGYTCVDNYYRGFELLPSARAMITKASSYDPFDF